MTQTTAEMMRQQLASWRSIARLLANRPTMAAQASVELTTLADGKVKPTVKATASTVTEAGRMAEAEFDRLRAKYNGDTLMEQLEASVTKLRPSARVRKPKGEA